VSKQSALAVGRPLLAIVRRDHIANAVETFNAGIDAAIVAPLIRGQLDEFEDWAGSGTTLIRYVTPGGVSTLRNLPTHLLTPKVRARLYEVFAAFDEAEASVTPSATRPA
jgi:hypothetical protein